ncbi:Uncharacterised protein [BD1-7 clade bacterium]|uniref:Type VI secretion system lipoprotein TssJ n=1 Tax=BD1-7 clade bacterium TaxID=2029982 RepID=A0A5S9Q7W5_9GAMM|nr:Uncharacterised protein [BD1-7 clade bacterium]CAA0114065.1 Uncharacterised protein [BD1-7 clade bacterium]CAA0115073.1 Uncharacterised protein [BD1-7 clade bacterium]
MRLISVVILSLLIGACSSAPKQYMLTINIHAAKNINPNLQGKPSPLEIRVYELSDDLAFTQNTFITLFESDQEALKDTLLLKRVFIGVEPGSKRTHKLPLAAKTHYLGILGGFADYQQASNKKTTAITVKDNVIVDIFIDGTSITTRKQD